MEVRKACFDRLGACDCANASAGRVVICTGKGKPAGFTRVLVTGTGTGPEILTPGKPVPVGPGHGFCHIDFKLRINSQRHLLDIEWSTFVSPPRLTVQKKSKSI
jgi:hypothetical protein